MSYRELTMIDVREVLRRLATGQATRRIARETGTDRKTVDRYAEAAEALGIGRDAELGDDVVHQVAQRVQGRRDAVMSDERAEIAAHRDQIEAWLTQKKPLRLSKVHTLLVRDHGVRSSYDTLRRYAVDELAWRRKTPTVLVADGKPGEEAQVDFGLMGTMLDADAKRVRKLYVFIVTLVFSRYQFVWPSFTQTTEAVCEALDAAWRFFGAMARVIVPDNMSAMISIADPLAPTIVPAFLDYAQARGLFVDAARVRSPKDKGRVENQVAFVRESWFAGETFHGLDDAREHAARWCRDIAGARVHGTTRQVPRDLFERDERPVMAPAPTTRFDVPTWTDAKVHPDHHVQVARSLYSVPTRYIGRTVRVRADRALVRIYLGTELIKTHARVPPGQRSTDASDYPADKSDYAMRTIDGVLARAKKRGAHVGLYAEKLLGGPLPWTRMRHAYALIGLCDKYGDGRVEAVCQSALAFDVVDVTRIGRMLKSAITPSTPTSNGGKVVAIKPPRFARSMEHFETRASTSSKEAT